MRLRDAGFVVLLGLMACGHVSGAQPPTTAQGGVAEPEFFIRPATSGLIPSPMVEVRAGDIHAVVPHSWEARPLPEERSPQRGFMASPRISDWDEGTGLVRGMEVYWIDIAEVRIPSDFYYLVARGPALGSLGNNKHCRAAKLKVLVDHPPALADNQFSPGDYVASAEGTCRTDGRRTQWAYVVAAPGYGPAREIGIPTSGLYVVIAVVSGSRSDLLLREMIGGARFGNATISQIVDLAQGAR